MSGVSNSLSATELVNSRPRPLGRLTLHWVRRLHLYLGLFLFPWAVLYGFSGFLFNHPAIMNSQPLRSFDRSAWSGTAMERPVDPHASVRTVIAQLESRGGPFANVKWIETEPVRYAGDFAFGKIDTEEGEISLLFDVLGNGGTIRQGPAKPAAPPRPAPFEVIPPALPAAAAPEFENRLSQADTLADQLQSSVPQLQKALGLSGRPPVITSVPDLLFVVESDGQLWRAAFNSLKGTLTAKPLEAAAPLPWRNFLLRMHTTHVYPFSRGSTKWLWVLGADVMALVLIYWGISGLLMWWQIKSTRRWGLAVLAVSAVAATLLAVGMHGVIHAG